MHLLLLALAGIASQQEEPGRLFISPMGEPFRGDAVSEPEKDWFRGADANADGRLTAGEMADDATRFFKRVDLNANSEIDPRENEHYEVKIAPEVSMRVGDWRDPDVGNGLQFQRKYRHGGAAGQFSYIDIPQPIMGADLNFDRGVSLAEFERAARSRFKLLDVNGDGKLEASELPSPKRKKARRR